MSDANRPITSRFNVPDALWQGLKQIGLEPSVVLRQARLPVTLCIRELRDRRQVSTEEFFRLWEAVRVLNPDPAAAILLVTQLDVATLPPSSFSAFIARDYRDGLHRLARFKQLCTPERLLVSEDDHTCTISIDWLHTPQLPPNLLIDAAFATFVELGRRGSRAHITPRKVELARPDDGSRALAEYFGCPVRYGAERNALLLDVADLDRPFSGHNPELLDMLNPALAAALAQATASASVSRQVKIALKRTLASGRPEIVEVARELGMSERTLQRRITEEGTSFRQLMLETRQEVVRHLLSEPSIEIDEIACLLGYEDTNSFYRAFRSWEGTTPARWRALQVQQPASPSTH
ncbi:AraC family transcriptional regulator [Pseudomonas sp. CCC3.1]|uniref:AraC family transcriptional regulator n=1 Tax=Pseudomonas sp. CCC3.1 TaxID=3048607 RepID=UPI002AC9BB8F|nr:AraC family transcriptional regulator ligand-binding domain-containing protein [Pseudomonas sp. CCC3.1]MEB0206806.1 AraC family transcriptional regulator ligand-binding domain-containing protein [Pseudomonas sp. CCC3.1]WPX37572.1 AraC family transcriptional regulator ligand-binding domain-containing protein [Pseudomonas sp. CCC3.1]